jgi:hypothetical protein
MARVVNFLSEKTDKRNMEAEAEARRQQETSASRSRLRWEEQLTLLQSLGFHDEELSLRFLDQFKGSMDRVVNALSETFFDNRTTTTTTRSSSSSSSSTRHDHESADTGNMENNLDSEAKPDSTESLVGESWIGSGRRRRRGTIYLFLY